MFIRKRKLFDFKFLAVFLSQSRNNLITQSPNSRDDGLTGFPAAPGPPGSPAGPFSPVLPGRPSLPGGPGSPAGPFNPC